MATRNKRSIGAQLKKKKLERLIASFFNRKHCMLLGSGTTSLYVIFKALGLPRSSKVLYPDITCETALNGAIYAGLTPLFCDIDLKTFNLSANKAITQCHNECEIDVIVPTHLFGNIINIDGLSKGLGEKKIFIVEDAAQSFGGALRGVKTGAMGDASIISFGSGKTIDCGGGGAVLTDSDKFYEQCLHISDSLSNSPAAREILRQKFLMDIFKLNKQGNSQETFVRERDRLKEKYKDAYVFTIDNENVNRISLAFNDIKRIIVEKRKKTEAIYALLSHNTGAELPIIMGEPVHWRYSFLVKGDRDEAFNRLKKCNIKASRFFKPLHLEYGLPNKAYPNSMKLYESIINIRLDYPEAQSKKIAATIDGAIEEYAA